MVVRCVMPLQFDQMEHVAVCALCDALTSEFIAIFCRPVHLSRPVDIAVQLHVLQLSFLFCGDLAGSSVYAGCLTCL